MFGPTWEARVESVSDRRDIFGPELTLLLIGTLNQPIGEMPLPRAGQVYWLVDDATFRRLAGLSN